MSLKAIPGSIRRARDEPAEASLKVRQIAPAPAKEELKRKLEASDPSLHAKKNAPLAIESLPFPQDADDEFSDRSASSDDEEEALIRELARIKQERAEEELKRQAREAAKEAAIRQDQAVSSNPLFAEGASSLRRRWDDDTVFKNQAGRPSETKGRQFVNDVVRSDFHKKFLAKYIQ